MSPAPDRSAYDSFAGRIGRTMSESVPAWPQPTRPPTGSPNIVIVLVDDLGFSDIGPYGSEIATPHLDRLGADGLVFTNYHTSPLCSPSRASLLTGLNPHRAGFAYPANSDPGYPAFCFELPDDAPTIAESLRSVGYATYMVGKWHLTGDRSLHDAADRSSWPLQRGFDRYFGSLEGFTSLHAPHRLVWDNSPYPVENFDDDYYLTDDLTDRAIEMISGLRANDATKPFLLYFAHHAVHGPVQATAADLADQAGRYDAGWDRIREQRFDRQLASGLFPAGTRLPHANREPGKDVESWDGLSAEQRARFARYMEAYAGAVSGVDRSVGRLVETLADQGELENTIFVFTSDNGGTAEGGAAGTRSYFSQFAHLPGLPPDWERDVDRDLDLIGGPQTAVHYPRGWGQVSNTPFRLYKGDTHAGGIRAPLIISWPAGGLGADDDHLRRQYLHVTDLTPTLLDLAGVEALTQRGGVRAATVDGLSAVDILRSADAQVVHREQYTETGGHRAYQTTDWKIVSQHRPGSPFDDSEWQLYDLRTDPTETEDLAAARPEIVAELAQAWETAAWQNRVFPLDDHGPASALRRPEDVRFGDPVRLRPATPTLERFRSAQLIGHRDFTIVIDVAVAAGDQGVLVAHGDQGGGYAVRIETDDDGEPAAVFVLNAYGQMHRSEPIRIALGRTELRVNVCARPGFRWQVDLTDGDLSASLPDVPQLLGMAPFTGISVGADRGGPVDWSVHAGHGSFAYTGQLHHVTYRPGAFSPEAPSERARVWAEGAKIYD